MENWQVGDHAEVASTSFDDRFKTLYGKVGKVVNVKTSEFKHFIETDLRLIFEDGYECWLPAEDCIQRY